MERDNIVYSQIPPKEAKLLNVQPQSSKQAKAFVDAFLKRSLPRLRDEDIQNRLKRQAVVLEHYLKKRTNSKRKNRYLKSQNRLKGQEVSLQHTFTKHKKKRKNKCLSAKERREMKIFDLKPDQHRYDLFLPLNGLWKQYIRSLCNGLKPDVQPYLIQTKLLKADLHGAIVTVVKSKCPSYVGTTGIILQELKHVFKIITMENKLKVIPKMNSVFSVEIDRFVSYIYGSKFQLRAGERSARKFKVKGSIDL
uniref:Ribonuclease P protein subunit p29 n=1 Tax=Callorhinchus milii TaxID=7868 RepID=V9L4Q2_CALMI